MQTLDIINLDSKIYHLTASEDMSQVFSENLLSIMSNETFPISSSRKSLRRDTDIKGSKNIAIKSDPLIRSFSYSMPLPYHMTSTPIPKPAFIRSQSLQSNSFPHGKSTIRVAIDKHFVYLIPILCYIFK